MDYTLAIYDQPAMDDLSIRATIEKLDQARLPGLHQDGAGVDAVPGARATHRQALRSRPQDGPLQARPQGLPRLPRAHERGAPRALPLEEDPPGDAALPLDRHALRAQRGRARTRRSSTRWRRRATPSTTRGSSPTSASASTRRTATAPSSTRSMNEPPALRAPRSEPRADAPQAAERREEALSAHELARWPTPRR